MWDSSTKLLKNYEQNTPGFIISINTPQFNNYGGENQLKRNNIPEKRKISYYNFDNRRDYFNSTTFEFFSSVLKLKYLKSHDLTGNILNFTIITEWC